MESRFPFQHPEIESLLLRLHDASKADKWKLAPRTPRYLWACINGRLKDKTVQHRIFHDVYSSISEERGALIYLIGRAIRARRVVEFGSSFGISTIYLATAVRDNSDFDSGSAGQVIGSEMEPDKFAVATKNLEAAGLSDIARILPGDALETLQAVAAPVDLVFLDGRKDLYLPVLKLLKPKLRLGAVVLSDNIFTFKRALGAFIEYMHCGKNGFLSATLNISDGFEFSIYQPSGE